MDERWRKALLRANSTIKEAIKNLDASGAQIGLVVDGAGKLLGTITDGDIRRGLLRGLTVEGSVDEIVFRDPLVVPPYLDRQTVLQLMQANRIHQLPVVNESRHVVGLHLLDELIAPVRRENLIVIMAGGRGARLRPHTEKCPKPMLAVGGKPVLEHIIERARSEGYYRFVIATHFLGHVIERYFGDGSRWNVEIEYLREESPLGTAGAIGLLQPRPTAPFVVSNGDVLTDIRHGELLDFHLRHSAMATMAVREYEWQHPFGVVKTDGLNIVGLDEKPVLQTHVSAGIYVLDPNVLGFLKVGERCDMPDLFRSVQASGARAIAYPMHEPWLDIGNVGDYERANRGPDTQTPIV